MSRVNCDNPSLYNSLLVDPQLELPLVTTTDAGQSETPVQGSPAALFNRDKILSEAITGGRCNEEEKNDRSKDEKPQCSAATGQEPTGDSTAFNAQERTSFEQTQPTSANEKPTEDESLLSSADERPHEGKPLLSSPDETTYQDKAPQRSTAEGEEQQVGEKALLNTLNQRHFLMNSGNSVPGSSPGPITSQPKDQYLVLKLELDTPTACAPLLQKNPIIVSEPGRGKPSTANGVLTPVQPVVTMPQKTHGKLQPHPSLNSQSSKRSKGSSKSSSSQLQSAAQEDCCAHCILACLFCEFLVLCNIALDCATCGSCSSDESCFCCCCGCGECGDCEVPCDMDCGIVDACCESADCLEICMECCGLCFSS